MNREIDRNTRCERMALRRSIRKTGEQLQDVGVTGGTKEGRRTERKKKKKKAIVISACGLGDRIFAV